MTAADGIIAGHPLNQPVVGLIRVRDARLQDFMEFDDVQLMILRVLAGSTTRSVMEQLPCSLLAVKQRATPDAGQPSATGAS